jgi:hypothetical protein
LKKQDGFISFGRVQDAMKAEKFLNLAGIPASAIVPPPHHDSTCNLGVVFDLDDKPLVMQTLKDKRVSYDYIAPLRGARDNFTP